MPKDYGTLAPNQVRRRDRVVEDDAWIHTFLETAPLGILATNDGEQPFINSNLFVFDAAENAIYLHTARVGRTRSNVDNGVNEREDTGIPACFHIMQMGRVLPADRALEFSIEYAGVTAFGPLTIVSEADEAKHCLQRIMDKYAPHLRPERDYEAATADDLKRTSVYKLAIDSWSGKRKVVADDFPGAFYYSEVVKVDDEGMIRVDLPNAK
jgi:nitroimidazol reductase NimA-like FMN-containing flavoprotein (pyridoxamine 5'-phosphate oxidase superfamily)